MGGQQQSKRKQDNGKLPILAQLARRTQGSRVCIDWSGGAWDDGILASSGCIYIIIVSVHDDDDNNEDQISRLLRRAAVAAPHAGDTFCSASC